MSEIYHVYRAIVGMNGTRIIHPLRSVTTEALAKEFCDDVKKYHIDIQKLHIVEVTPQGPRGVSTLPLFFQELGIANMGTVTMAAPLHESNLIIPRTPAILDS